MQSLLNIIAIGEAVPATDTGVNVFKYIFVVILFVFLAWIFTKTFANKLTGARRGKLIRHVETSSIGGDKRLTLVEVEGVSYLIYSDRTGSLLIDKREDIIIKEPEISEESEGLAPPMPYAKSFKAVLDELVKKKRDD